MSQTDLCIGTCTVGGNICFSDFFCTTPGEGVLLWEGLADHGGVSLVYDTLRSADATDFTSGVTCVETNGANTITNDPDTPPPGGIRHYLVRPENGCPGGDDLGTDSAGTQRTGAPCE